MLTLLIILVIVACALISYPITVLSVFLLAIICESIDTHFGSFLPDHQPLGLALFTVVALSGFCLDRKRKARKTLRQLETAAQQESAQGHEAR
jgi:hypothetical protein